MKNLVQIFNKSKHLALSLVGLLALGIAPANALNIGVTPPRFEIDLNKDKTRSYAIRVLNLDAQPATMRVVVRSWVMGEDNKLQDVAPTEQSLAQWIVFTPSQFTIPPGGSQTLRFAVRPKVQPQSGEHRAVIYFEEVPPANDTLPNKTVRIIGRLGVVVYGYVGNIKREGIVNSVTVDTKQNSLNAIFDISNQGNGYVRLGGQYGIWPAAKYPGVEATKPIANLGKPGSKLPDGLLGAGTLPQEPVLPNNQRKLNLLINQTLPPGNYVLDINGDLSGSPLQKAIPFVVPERKK